MKRIEQPQSEAGPLEAPVRLGSGNEGCDEGKPENKQDRLKRSAGASAKKGDGSGEAMGQKAATNLEKPLVKPRKQTGKQASELTEADVKRSDKTDAIYWLEKKQKMLPNLTTKWDGLARAA